MFILVLSNIMRTTIQYKKNLFTFIVQTNLHLNTHTASFVNLFLSITITESERMKFPVFQHT